MSAFPPLTLAWVKPAAVASSIIIERGQAVDQRTFGEMSRAVIA